MTTGGNQLSGWTEKKLQSTSQSQTCTKKEVMVTAWWSAACLIHYSFLNPSETITSEKYAQQIDQMHWKLQCLQPALVSRKDPVHPPWQLLTARCTTSASKVERIGLQSFASSAIFTDLSPTNYHFFKHFSFLQGKCFHSKLEAENPLLVFISSWSTDF